MIRNTKIHSTLERIEIFVDLHYIFCSRNLRNADLAQTLKQLVRIAFSLVQAQTSRAPLFNQNSSDKMSRSARSTHTHTHSLFLSLFLFFSLSLSLSLFLSRPSHTANPLRPILLHPRTGIDGKCSHRTVYRDTIAL